MGSSEIPYRPCVGLALFNSEGKVFVGERIDSPGAWQMPQGGINVGENIRNAAYRELHEEIGTANADILEIMKDTLRYDLPKHLMGKLWGGRYRGQDQTWIAMRFTGRDTEINLAAGSDHAEFRAWRWVPLNECLNLIVPFKRDIYEKVIEAFSQHAVPPKR